MKLKDLLITSCPDIMGDSEGCMRVVLRSDDPNNKVNEINVDGIGEIIINNEDIVNIKNGNNISYDIYILDDILEMTVESWFTRFNYTPPYDCSLFIKLN